jgi:[ribosomal protein S18]-alanine N-acetyltransferase
MTAFASVSFKDLNATQWQSLTDIEAACHFAPWSAQQLQASAQAGYVTQALLNPAQQVLGYSIFMPNVDDWELLNITVASTMQGAGLGHLLLAQGLHAAQAAGTSGVFLEVRPSNSAAVGLYVTTGFKQVGTRKGYYRTVNPLIQEDAWVMRLDFK